ncbi:MAG: EAL domain-containing protein [Methylovulum sp.]|nr:EAL domain-containing protein [Methylovulum sp.]
MNSLSVHLIPYFIPYLTGLISVALSAIGMTLAWGIYKHKQAKHIPALSEEKFRIMFETSPMGIVKNALDGRYLEANDTLLTMLGYSLAELNKLTYRQLSPQEYEPEESRQLENLRKTHRYGPFEKEYIHKDGHRFAVRLNGVLVNDSDGGQYIWSFIENITQKKATKAIDELIWQQTNFDLLTSLPNRHMFHDRLNQEIKKTHRNNRQLALLFLNLDRFKQINDSLGHGVGDEVLKKVAKRLNHCAREVDTVARLGGDEFAVILGNLEDFNTAESIAERMRDDLSKPFRIGSEIIYISVSIGITCYPENATTSEELLKCADQAVYYAKNQGRNRYSFFNPSMQEVAQKKMKLVNDLHTAIAEQQFYVVYQPIVDLNTGLIGKAEALIRWPHPTLGLISPSEFIPIAEDTGMIIDIGTWVFRQAAQQAKLWRARYNADFQISVNKSPVQLQNQDYHYESWASQLKKMALPGQSIVVEITESMLLDNNNLIDTKLREFREAGIQISLDDFGTGYSSLSYLKKFNIDYLKIDQSFVRNLDAHSDDMALCEAIIVMAHKLGIKVIAEGIETSEQRDLLTAADCDYGQGYLFSKPVRPEEFAKLFARDDNPVTAI